MREKNHRLLIRTAVVLTLAWVGWSLYDGVLVERAPGDTRYLAGNRYFEDGHYEQALQEYEGALAIDSAHIHALRGKARSLMLLGRDADALTAFDEAVHSDPEFGPTYANRGILRDRMGNYEAAILDYEQALTLDPELADGPHWLTRFLRNQARRPPTIADRSAYLRNELSKPVRDRRLRDPAQDAQQRPYRL